jgi:hypothetical protein
VPHPSRLCDGWDVIFQPATAPLSAPASASP